MQDQPQDKIIHVLGVAVRNSLSERSVSYPRNLSLKRCRILHKKEGMAFNLQNINFKNMLNYCYFSKRHHFLGLGQKRSRRGGSTTMPLFCFDF